MIIRSSFSGSKVVQIINLFFTIQQNYPKHQNSYLRKYRKLNSQIIKYIID